MFDSHYEVFLADTDESKESNYSIHSNTYCKEMGFKNKENFPRKSELDDQDSAHFIVRHKSTKTWTGAMKLIFQNDQSLPIVTDSNLQAQATENTIKPAVKLSRLCAAKETRTSNSSDRIEDERTAIQNGYKEKSLPNRRKINRSIIWGPFEVSLEGYLIQ